MSEFVVDRLEIPLVQQVHIGRVHIVDGIERNLGSAFGRTQHDLAVVVIGGTADQKNHLREVAGDEVAASGHLVVSLQAEVLDQLGHLNRLLVVRGSQIVDHVALHILITVAELDVIRLDIVFVKPRVQRRLRRLLRFDDTRAAQIVFGTRAARKSADECE